MGRNGKTGVSLSGASPLCSRDNPRLGRPANLQKKAGKFCRFFLRLIDLACYLLQTKLLFALAEGTHPQRIELDEARRIAVVVGDRAFLEGDEFLVVQ